MNFIFPTKEYVIKSSKSERLYNLVRPDQIDLSQEAATQILHVCQEPQVYKNVFQNPFKNRAYSLADAQWFLNYVSEGWIKQSHFDWLIFFQGKIVGTIGIKSNEGEIGYWQSQDHPGVMANALNIVSNNAARAGFPSLWAYVKKENIGSIRVLEKNLFLVDSELTSKPNDTFGYRRVF